MKVENTLDPPIKSGDDILKCLFFSSFPRRLRNGRDQKFDGRTRAIFFRMGRPIGADTSQAEGYPEFRATKESDLHLIRIGNERYEIPDALVLGG